uniref:Uncharacterized protein n=1 Tax=Rhizophora mucronata TaxID=61149 RepID=A0A2P2J049_RHIMU
MVRKRTNIPEFQTVEMARAGVRTGAQAQTFAAAAAAVAVTASATATSSGTGKKRKVDNQEVHISTTYNVKIRSGDRTRRIVGTTPENSRSHSPEVNSGHHAVLEGLCSNRSSDHASASCCSSNGTSERIEFADLKVKTRVPLAFRLL